MNNNLDNEKTNYIAGTKLLLIAILACIILALFTVVSYSQNLQTSIAFDVRNGFIGSNPTNNQPKLDILFGVKYTTEKNLIFGVSYEQFKAIGFEKMCINGGYVFELGKFSITPAFEPTLINRKVSQTVYQIVSLGNINQYTPEYLNTLDYEVVGNDVYAVDYKQPLKSPYRDGYYALAFNCDFDYFINDNLGIGIHTNLLQRSDLKALYGDDKWVVSNYLKLTYKFNTY